MSTGRSDRRIRLTAALLCGPVLLVPGLLGCGEDPTAPPPRTQQSAPPEVTAEIAEVLRQRTAAVRSGDLPAFTRTVDPRLPALVEAQEAYFLNLRDLPLAEVGFTLQGAVPKAGGDGLMTVVVETTLQLDGYDAAAVRMPSAATFRRDAERGWVLVEARDEAFDREHDIEPQPWDLTRIEVEEGDGVLGIFDAGSVDEAYQIIPAVEESIEQVARQVPVTWNRRVVVYALSDTRILASLDDLPGGDPDLVDGVAFPVRVAEGSPQLAATRFMLHPRMIGHDSQTRRRLIRHELTHVALGPLDDNVPTWLAEGVAEWVSLHPVPAMERRIAAEALQAARGGLTGLPRDDDFNGQHSSANYGIAWEAIEYVAAAYGDRAVWALLQAMGEGDGTTAQEQDDVLRRVIGIDSRELATRTGEKIVREFG